jgi:hypothetical protein
MNPAILQALLAALLFGASTPLAKLLTGEVSPLLLAGLLYLGSGTHRLDAPQPAGGSPFARLPPRQARPTKRWHAHCLNIAKSM